MKLMENAQDKSRKMFGFWHFFFLVFSKSWQCLHINQSSRLKFKYVSQKYLLLRKVFVLLYFPANEALSTACEHFYMYWFAWIVLKCLSVVPCNFIFCSFLPWVAYNCIVQPCFVDCFQCLYYKYFLFHYGLG